MNMPVVPEEIFMEGMKQLVALDKEWIPVRKEHSLYIRPVMFASDTVLGVRPSENYKFLILLSPTGPYYAQPMKIMVEEKYTRAAPGGVGFSKNAGNYGGSMLAASLARQKGYDQVLWTDSVEHKWLQEVGMMNVFFIIKNIAITPSLEDGTILEGVTRASVIQLLKDMNVAVEERKISIDEVMDAYRAGAISEVFGTGTAAVIAPIRELNYRGTAMEFNTDTYKISDAVKNLLADLREGRISDKYGWMLKV
jgi:branched-chain amino acid aminotransferase